MIWVVGGFPRSGTTAMMRLLAEHGWQAVAEPTSPTLEPTPMQLRFGLGHSDGQAIKMLWPPRLVQLPRGDWSVVVMRRDPAAVIESWRHSQPKGWPSRWHAETMGAELDAAVEYLRSRSDVATLHQVHISRLRDDPSGVADLLGLSR